MEIDLEPGVGKTIEIYICTGCFFLFDPRVCFNQVYASVQHNFNH